MKYAQNRPKTRSRTIHQFEKRYGRRNCSLSEHREVCGACGASLHLEFKKGRMIFVDFNLCENDYTHVFVDGLVYSRF